MTARMLALVTDAFGGTGGIAKYNRALLAEMVALRPQWRVRVLPRNAGSRASPTPSRIEQSGASPGRCGYAVRAWLCTGTEGPFDVVFCGHLFMAPLARLLARRSNAVFWLQLHGIEAWARPNAVYRRAVEQAHLVTAVSRHTRREFLRWANMPPHRVKVLPNTLAEPPAATPRARRHGAGEGLGGEPALLTVGRLSARERYKGHDRVISVLPRLLQSHPGLVYAIVGDGDDRPRLERLAERCGVTDRVRFLGQVPEHELRAIYSMADVYVMPSTGEGFGIVFLEALAAGLTVIGGDRDGGRDPLRDGGAGLLVDPDDPEALVTALKSALAGGAPAAAPASPFRRAYFRRQLAAILGRLPLGGRENR